MSFAKPPTAGIHDEEVLERLVTVVVAAEVGQVVTELHGFGVHLAVGPLAEHGRFGCRVGIAVMSVASILKVVHRDNTLGLGRIEVTAYASLQQ